ncbi:hypothetical protein [Paraburkholderia sp. MM6662-R1]|uniref:hypothetical protein n=1 Tax=Paraburkholderia sp. MM6662-R1 TaxID=2991066 RepID=UPI003D1A06FF
MEINLFKDLVDAVGAAGDAISKVTDGVAHMISTGVKGYDAARARIVYAKLLKASAQYEDLMAFQTPMTLDLRNLAESAEHGAGERLDEKKLADRWNLVAADASQILLQVSELLDEIRRDRSDFVLEPAYAKIRQLLSARVSLLEQLVSMGPPTSPEEATLVRNVEIRYDMLIYELALARDGMNTYLKSLKAPKKIPARQKRRLRKPR